MAEALAHDALLDAATFQGQRFLVEELTLSFSPLFLVVSVITHHVLGRL